MQSPELSLIVATVGRVEPLRRLLQSLAAQTTTRFEVILVDQNPDDRLDAVILREGAGLDIQHLRSELGLSRARNVGLRAARAPIIGIPDDDCWYDTDVVQRCLAFFEQHPGAAGLAGVSRDEEGKESGGRFDRDAGAIDRANVFRRGISYTMFCRTEVARAIGGFDEALGLGAGTPWGSGEETDFVLRCIARGHLFHFDPSFVVRHPRSNPPTMADARRRGRAYGRGFARVLKLHGYSRGFMAQAAARPMLGAALALARGRTRAAALSFWGAVGRIDELRAG